MIASAVAISAEAAVLVIIATVATSAAGDASATVTLRVGALHVAETPAALLWVGLVLVVIRTGGELVSNWAIARRTAAYEADSRKALVDAYISARWVDQQAMRAGALESVALADVEMARFMYESAMRFIPALIGFLLLLAVAFVASPFSSAVLIGVATVLALVFKMPARLAQKSMQQYLTSRTNWAQELSSTQAMNREIKVYGAGPWMQRRSREFLREQRRERQRSDFLNSSVPSAYQSVIYALAVVLLLFIAVTDENLARLAPAILLLVRGLSYSQRVQGTMHNVLDRNPYFRAVETAAAQLRSGAESTGSNTKTAWRRLSFEEVSFGYAGRSVIHSLSLDVARGEIVGVIGSSGAGKSTIASLALGLLQPDSGRVRIDGVDLHDTDPLERARNVAFVPQEAHLITRSVREDIIFDRKFVTNDDVVTAARASGVTPDFSGRDGLSVGQRQRVAIARALVGRPALVVFDEPTSALDPESEALVHEAIERLRRDAMVLVISHHRQTAELCDRVLWIEDGHLMGEGSGEEMWSRAGFSRFTSDAGAAQ